MTQLNLFKYFKASLPSPWVILPWAHCHTKCHQQWLVQWIRKSRKWWQTAIATLTTNGSYAFFVGISSHTRNHYNYIRGILSCTNETKFPGISIVHSLSLYDDVVLHQRPLMFHYAITKIFLTNLLFNRIYWFLRKFDATEIWCPMVAFFIWRHL